MKISIAITAAGIATFVMAPPTLAQVTAPSTDGVIIRCPAEVNVVYDIQPTGVPAEWTKQSLGHIYRFSSAVIARSRNWNTGNTASNLECHYTSANLPREAPEIEYSVLEHPYPAGMVCTVSAKGGGRFDCVPNNRMPTPQPRGRQ